jgi:rare lipoprotein A
MTVTRAVFFALGLCLAGCAAVPNSVPPASSVEQPIFSETGAASWYGRKHQGQKTAQGERFDMNKLTAAHRTLPLNTTVRVTNMANQKSVKVRINDRGPFVKARIIDLSARAARELEIAEDGTAEVRLEVFASDQAGAE